MQYRNFGRGLLAALVLTCGIPASVSAQDDVKGPVASINNSLPVVPNVVGMTYIQAIPVIQNAGFYAKSNLSLSVARNKVVISQTPAAGPRAARNTFVIATVQP